MAFTRSIRDITHGTWSFSAGWTDVTTPWGILGGHAKFATAASAVATNTLPANHGFTGGVLIGFAYGSGSQNAVVDVDGTVVQAAWNERTGTSVDSRHWCPRVLSWPFLLNPNKPASATQLIHLTAGADGGVTYILGIELFTAAAPVAGRVTGTGHSMEYPVIDSNTKGPASYGHRQQFVAYLNAINYLGIAWTGLNQGVPSENLMEGSASSGLSGGPNSAGAYPQFTNQTMYDNTAILTPAWMRHEACDTWPNTGGHAPRLGTGLFTTDADYMAGVAQWAGSLFQMGIYWHAFNDAGFVFHLDFPPDDVVANLASALKTIATVTVATGTPNSGTFTITDGTHPTVMGPLSNLATLQANCVASGLPVTVTSNVAAGSSQLAAVGNQVTFTANTRGTLTLTKSADSVGGGTVTFAVTQVGRPQIPAGAGYAVKKFKDRFRADLIRPLLAITPVPKIFVLGCMNRDNGGPNVPLVWGGSGSLLGFYEQLDNAMQEVIAESWIPAICGGINPVIFVPLRGVTTGIRSNVSAADPHPSQDGHNAITRAIIDAFEKGSPFNYRPTGQYSGGVS